MNLLVDDAVEVTLEIKKGPAGRRQLGQSQPVSGDNKTNALAGQILLKGDNVSLIQAVQ